MIYFFIVIGFLGMLECINNAGVLFGDVNDHHESWLFVVVQQIFSYYQFHRIRHYRAALS